MSLNAAVLLVYSCYVIRALKVSFPLSLLGSLFFAASLSLSFMTIEQQQTIVSRPFVGNPIEKQRGASVFLY